MRNAATWPSLGQFWNVVQQWHIQTKMKQGPEAALVVFCFLRTELEKWRQTSHQDLATNPIFKCDKCSYTAISRTVLKHSTRMKHPNKDEPEAFGKLVLENSLKLFNTHDKKQIIYIKHIKKMSSLKKSISSAIVGLATKCVNSKIKEFFIPLYVKQTLALLGNLN